MSDLTQHIARMFDEAPCDWWWFVPCATCNARRRELCVGPNRPASGPHIARRRSAQVLHGTLWLLREFPDDVLGGGT